MKFVSIGSSSLFDQRTTEGLDYQGNYKTCWTLILTKVGEPLPIQYNDNEKRIYKTCTKQSGIKTWPFCKGYDT